MEYVIIGLVVLALIIIIANIRIVPQANAYVVEKLGIYDTTWPAGFHFKVPFISRVAKIVSLKEQVVDFKPQPVITRDNVTMQIDTVVFFQVTDPKLFTYGVERPISAIENLTATTLRNIIGELELDSTLTSRDVRAARHGGFAAHPERGRSQPEGADHQGPGGAGKGCGRQGHQDHHPQRAAESGRSGHRRQGSCRYPVIFVKKRFPFWEN